mgnify:CR=1 FL=1
MCRTGGRRCPRHRSAQRDRERRVAMRTYRADLHATAALMAGPQALDVIASAPTAALAALATELGLDPHTISSVSPSARVNHDITETLRAFAAARSEDLAAGQRAVTSRPAEALPYRVVPPDQTPSVAVLARTALDTVAPPSLADTLTRFGGPHAGPEDFDAVEADVVERRARYTDLCVAAARAQRFDLDAEDWQQWREREVATQADAEASTRSEQLSRVWFHTCDGEELALSLRQVHEITAAYQRLTGTTDIGAAHFATAEAADAATAFVAHLGYCNTPVEAIGDLNWSGYLNRAGGDAEAARHAAAADVARLADDQAFAYLTRLSTDNPNRRPIGYRDPRGLDKVSAPVLAERAEVVSRSWLADTAASWEELGPAHPPAQRVLMETVLGSRYAIADNPFTAYDLPEGVDGAGGVYGPEQCAVEEIARGVRELRNSGDPAAETVADAICEAAHQARALPTDTLAQRTERQWQLAELAEAAERLAVDPENLAEVTLVPFDDPGQMDLFGSTAREAA